MAQTGFPGSSAGKESAYNAGDPSLIPGCTHYSILAWRIPWTKVCLVKAMVFPVVMYGRESWTVKMAER